MRLRIVAALVTLTVLFGAACSDDDGGEVEASDTTAAEAEDTEGREEHNNADVTFVTNMIPHHEQAVEMSGMAANQAEDQRVKDLAARIAGAQQPEIDQMRGFLEAWGESAEMGDMDMDTDGMAAMEGMEGMMSEDEMAELAAATGAGFDTLFLEMMIEHHEGAITMAEDELAEGQSREALELAQSIQDSQGAEIEEMQDLLDDLGG